jgi:hypothetical protein
VSEVPAQLAVQAWRPAQTLRFAGGALAGLLLAAIVWLGLVRFQMGAPTESTRWNHAILERKRSLAAAAPAPRLLVIGGSNVLFGVRAAQLQRELGVHAVNFGTHAALGRRYLLREAERALKPGDTAVLCLEYELYSGDEINDTLVDYLLSRDPGYLLRFEPLKVFRTLYGVPPARVVEGCRNRLRPPGRSSSGYDERTVNEYGDETLNDRPQQEMERIRVAGYTPNPFLAQGCPMDQDAVGDLQAFFAWCNAHQVRLYASFPSTIDFPQYHTPTAESGMRRFTEWYRAAGVKLLGAPETFLYPATDFFDTNYHLQGRAAAARTQTLIQLLRAG